MDTTLYNRLADSLTDYVGDRIYPVHPTGDILLPYVIYTLVKSDDFPNLNSASAVRRYTYQIDYWSVNQSENNTISDAITSTLNGWRSYPTVQGSFRQSVAQQLEDVAYHGQQTYLIIG